MGVDTGQRCGYSLLLWERGFRHINSLDFWCSKLWYSCMLILENNVVIDKICIKHRTNIVTFGSENQETDNSIV